MSIPTVVAKEPKINKLIIGNPAFFIELRLIFNNKKKMEIGATYLNITLYNPILFEAEGISFRFAITAVKRMTRSAAPNCFPNFVFPA